MAGACERTRDGRGRRDPRSFAWNDPFDLDGQLTEDEKLVRDSARAFAQGYLLPRAREDYLEERFDREILMQMAALDSSADDSAKLWRRRARPRRLWACCSRS